MFSVLSLKDSLWTNPICHWWRIFDSGIKCTWKKKRHPLEKDTGLNWARGPSVEEDGLNIEELDLAFLLSLECFDPSKPIDKQEEDKLGDSWDNYGFEDTELQSPLDGLKSPRPSPKWNDLGRVDGGHGNFQGKPKWKQIRVVVEKGTRCTEKAIASAVLTYSIPVLVD